jgi:hypothetical protein
VHEKFHNETVWKGVVEVFTLTDHKAGKAYAWSHEADSGGRRYVAVLHHPPIDTPLKAVQASIMAEYQAKHGKG